MMKINNTLPAINSYENTSKVVKSVSYDSKTSRELSSGGLNKGSNRFSKGDYFDKSVNKTQFRSKISNEFNSRSLKFASELERANREFNIKKIVKPLDKPLKFNDGTNGANIYTARDSKNIKNTGQKSIGIPDLPFLLNQSIKNRSVLIKSQH